MDENPPKKAGCTNCFQGFTWWCMLILAVTAVPLIGAALALTITSSQMGQILVFVGSCWTSTWLGMWLMKQSNHFHDK